MFGREKAHRLHEEIMSLLSTPLSVLSCITDPPRRSVSQTGKSTSQPCGPRFVPNATAAEHKQYRVRKVATLARSGERSRALAAARSAPPVRQSQSQFVQESGL